MSTVTKPYTYVSAATILAAEVNANEDAIIAGVNDIVNAQVNASAAIDGSKLADASVTAAKLSTSGLLSTQDFINLIRNGDFVLWGAGTSTVPTHFSLYLTPTIARDTKPTSSPNGYSCKITGTTEANEGISQAITCRAGASYVIAFQEKVTSGDTITCYITDNGSTPVTSTNDYTDTAWTRKSVSFTAASDATTITLYFRAKTATDIVWVGEASITEGTLLKQFTPYISHFVDRGSPSSYDYTVANFSDGAWVDLDLSSIVPAGATGIYIWFVLRNPQAGRYFRLRKNGDTGYNQVDVYTQAANVYITADVIVACDTNRVIEYYLDPTIGFDTLNFLVRGWWL